MSRAIQDAVRQWPPTQEGGQTCVQVYFFPRRTQLRHPGPTFPATTGPRTPRRVRGPPSWASSTNRQAADRRRSWLKPPAGRRPICLPRTAVDQRAGDPQGASSSPAPRRGGHGRRLIDHGARQGARGRLAAAGRKAASQAAGCWEGVAERVRTPGRSAGPDRGLNGQQATKQRRHQHDRPRMIVGGAGGLREERLPQDSTSRANNPRPRDDCGQLNAAEVLDPGGSPARGQGGPRQERAGTWPDWSDRRRPGPVERGVRGDWPTSGSDRGRAGRRPPRGRRDAGRSASSCRGREPFSLEPRDPNPPRFLQRLRRRGPPVRHRHPLARGGPRRWEPTRWTRSPAIGPKRKKALLTHFGFRPGGQPRPPPRTWEAVDRQ